MATVQGNIKPIDRTAVHRICSGQVVLDLATAVKELVENSLDAGATTIDIRLKDHGAELIEVADNGTGVSPENYQALTLKYYTSKIANFADLQSLSSFGFRGEALSSLCSLAEVTIVTRTKDDPIAVRLQYEHSGLIASQENVARSVGTTVSVAKLFSPLPVRFREFRRENNLRREYGRLLSVLQAYALIAKGVRIICSHQTGRAGRTVVVQTQGNASTRDNVVTVFGTKTAACMERLDLSVSETCSVEGFVSKPGAGCGRPSGDRQFFYVNGRPVDMPKFAKLLNELYRSFNSVQYPMVVLNFILPTTAYDVNVTPDKRKLFLHSEKELLTALRESLEQVYAPAKYTYAINSFESGTISGKGASSGTKLGILCKKTDIHVQSNVSTDECTDEDGAEDGVATKSQGDIEDETNVSNESPLNIFSFQHKITMGLADERVAEIGTVSSATCGRNLPDVRSDEKIQDLAPCASLTKRQMKDSEGALLSEEPLLKRWRQLNAIDKKAGDARIEEVDDIHDEEDGVDGRPDATGLQACNAESCTAEKEILLASCGEDGTDVEPASEVTLSVRRMVPCSTSGVDKLLPFTTSIEDTAENGEVELRHKLAEIREDSGSSQLQHQEPDASKEPGKANSDRVNQIHPKGLSGSINWLTKVGLEKKVAQTKEMCAAPARAKAKDQEGQERLSFSIDRAVEVDSEREIAQKEETVKSREESPVLQFDMDKLQRKFDLGFLQSQRTNSSSRKQMGARRSCFAAATLNGVGKDSNEKEAVLEAATKELERSFNKADFKKMKVLGQFNLGFILAKINDDIFIVDQHASDEKYNFERLSKTTVLNRQPLLRPLPLELSAAEEMTVLSHIETFRQNGFDFVENKNAPCGQRLQLSSVPFSQNVTFGVGGMFIFTGLLARRSSTQIQKASFSRTLLKSRE